MLSRPQFFSAVILGLLAIVLWDQSRIRTLKRELESRHNSVPPPTIPGNTAPLTVPKAAPANTGSGEGSPPKAPGVGTRVAPAGDMGLETSLEKWLERVNRLKAWLDRKPELKTSELDLASNEDWLFATYQNKTESEEDLRKAYDWVLNGVENRVNSAFLEAIHEYNVANGSSPTTVDQIVPYLSAPIGEFVLKHFERTALPGGFKRRHVREAK